MTPKCHPCAPLRPPPTSVEGLRRIFLEFPSLERQTPPWQRRTETFALTKFSQTIRLASSTLFIGEMLIAQLKKSPPRERISRRTGQISHILGMSGFISRTHADDSRNQHTQNCTYAYRAVLRLFSGFLSGNRPEATRTTHEPPRLLGNKDPSSILARLGRFGRKQQDGSGERRGRPRQTLPAGRRPQAQE